MWYQVLDRAQERPLKVHYRHALEAYDRYVKAFAWAHTELSNEYLRQMRMLFPERTINLLQQLPQLVNTTGLTEQLVQMVQGGLSHNSIDAAEVRDVCTLVANWMSMGPSPTGTH